MHLAASSSVRPPPGSRTTRRPAPSRPAAVPAPAGPPDLAAEQGVARAPGVEHRGRRQGQRALERREELRQERLDVRRRAAERRRRSRAARAAGRPGRTATLTPIPRTAQPSCGRALGEDPRDLAPVEQHVVGPLDPRRGPARLRDGDGGDERQEGAAAASRRTSEHSSARPGGADHVRPWRPRPGRLRRGRDERAVRGAARRERPRAVVRRRRRPQVQARAAQPRAAGRGALTPRGCGPRRRARARGGARPSRG